ncbi:PHF5-like protein-domain-containing protein, partial [Lentinula raphanica]
MIDIVFEHRNLRMRKSQRLLSSMKVTLPMDLFHTLPKTLTQPQAILSSTCFIMSKHHPDLIMCRRQPGIAIGRLCEKCDGKCPGCDSYVRPETLVRICDECNFGSYGGRCIICGSPGISDAY